MISEDRVVVVDDDIGVANFVCRALAGQKFDVLRAYNGAEALQLCERFKENVKLVVLDIVMPGLKGDDLHVCLKSKFPKMKTLFMSGYSVEVLSEHGLTGSEDNFLQKPFTVQQLGKKVHDILGDR